MSDTFVAILMGSDSDLPIMQATIDVLESLDVNYEVKITSAHRTPAATHAYVNSATERGCGVFIAAAGMAAHLAGTVAGPYAAPGHWGSDRIGWNGWYGFIAVYSANARWCSCSFRCRR